MLKAAALLLLLLTSCTAVKTNEEPYIIEGPPDASVYLTGYGHKEIFYGYEASIAFPFLEPIPVVGTFLSGKLISLRSGAVRPIFVPSYREKTYESQHLGGRCAPAVLRVPFGVQ
jgi:hypothetical protein